ncbi:MAG: hypothetical protein JXR75_01465 [Rhodobacteraceae bacterium]|nr:hypothetical protein [Paracoccaceae bacterium]
MTANPFAYLMLVFWPVVSWIFFTKLDPARALIWTILAAYMLLPPVIAIDLPMVPDFDKYAVGNLSAALAVLVLLKDRFAVLPSSMLGRALIALYVLGPFATVLTNTDPIEFQLNTVPAMKLYDSLAVVANQFISLLPFFLARKYLATPDAMRAILVALVVAGLIYSLPMLVEMRLSPQLNQWVYGYFQHDFSQSIRFGGFRPFVFMPHGLWVAFFALMCFIAAVTLFRVGPADDRPRYAVLVAYLAVVLLLCRSAGPLLYALLLAPAILVLPRRLQALLAGVIVVVVIAYPLLRGLHLIPLDQLMDVAMKANAERGQSLQFRIVNEEVLLTRAAERPLFGWGTFGRGLLHDPITGAVNVIADGGWIITLGAFGWVGYIAEFGLLASPVLLFSREALRQSASALSPYACAVVLVLAVNLFDMLPNNTLIPFTWLLAGAVTGHAEALRAAFHATRKRGYEAGLRSGRTVL